MTDFMNGWSIRSAVLASAALLLAAPAYAQTACDADPDGDGVVGAPDLASLLGAWGPCVGCSVDVNDSGTVDAADIAAMLSLWGVSCNPLPWATVLEQSPNPAIVTSGTLRKAIAATGLPWRVRDNVTNIEMVLIPPGSFQMGCSAASQSGCQYYENPVHAVTLTNAFYMGRFEVTQAQWTAQMGSNPSQFYYPSQYVPSAEVPNRPVERVNWNMIQGFLSATDLRLPTEAEWEYACRAGVTRAFHGWSAQPAGTNDFLQSEVIAWSILNSNGSTRPVGGKTPNGFGLHDMLGNVWEWVNDWWSEAYYASSPSTNPPGPSSGTDRVLRGGSWGDWAVMMRNSGRVSDLPSANGPTYGASYGFRVARNP